MLKRQTDLTVSDLLKFIETETESLTLAAKEHAESNVDAGIPVSLCPANLLYKVLSIRHPERIKLDQPRPGKRSTSAAGIAATAEREDENVEAVEPAEDQDLASVGSATLGSRGSRKRWASCSLTQSTQAAASDAKEAATATAPRRVASLSTPGQRRRLKLKSTPKVETSCPKTKAKAKAKAKAKPTGSVRARREKP